ncbi:alcohol dehydrogenase [Gloeopeniophorella convolvens]|nr:alcohol dehydrogenase [Gloeopeniophorella convolvens]
MTPISNHREVLQAFPTGLPIPGEHIAHDTSQVIDLDNVELDGGFLAKSKLFSIEPVLRRRMTPNTAGNFTVGETIAVSGVAQVIRSEIPSSKPGDYIKGNIPCMEYFVRKDAIGLELLETSNIPLSAHVGVLGSPGKTAYFGWKEFSKAKKGEIIFVSSAASAVGSVVVQLAKREGLKVIGSAGSDDKVEFVRSLGADVAFNYKTVSTEDDNVGGETLDVAISNAAGVGSHFIECGMISGYNDKEPYRLKNAFLIISKEISIFGFWVGRWGDKYGAEFAREMPKLIKSGEVKYMEDISYGLDKIGQSITDVLVGANYGKKIVQVHED